MNKCLNNCGTEISSRAKFCSDKCRMSYKRSEPEHEQSANPNTNKPEQPTRTNPNTANHGQPNCECLHCQSKNGKIKHINHGLHKPAHALADGEVNRVSLPGDKDYTGQAVEQDGQWESR
jgi:hypothetical protein